MKEQQFDSEADRIENLNALNEMYKSKGWGIVTRNLINMYDNATERRETFTPGSQEDWKLYGIITAIKDLAFHLNVDLRKGLKSQKNLDDLLNGKNIKQEQE